MENLFSKKAYKRHATVTFSHSDCEFVVQDTFRIMANSKTIFRAKCQHHHRFDDGQPCDTMPQWFINKFFDG